MRKIDYYVATSIDGFISGVNEDISGFNIYQKSEGVNKYLNDLKNYDTVIMGRKTYEFGFKFGLKPGELAYPHMKHYIFSNNLILKTHHQNLKVCNLDLRIINKLKNENGSNIYLCGGGEFAYWLLESKQIDRLIIKLNPFIQGAGSKLFKSASQIYKLELIENKVFEDGLMTIVYDVKYD